MNAGRTIFSQVMDFLPINDFRHCVERYHGNYKIKRFPAWHRFLSLSSPTFTSGEGLG